MLYRLFKQIAYLNIRHDDNYIYSLIPSMVEQLLTYRGN